jgi:hypothetical protein
VYAMARRDAIRVFMLIEGDVMPTGEPAVSPGMTSGGGSCSWIREHAGEDISAEVEEAGSVAGGEASGCDAQPGAPPSAGQAVSLATPPGC